MGSRGMGPMVATEGHLGSSSLGASWAEMTHLGQASGECHGAPCGHAVENSRSSPRRHGLAAPSSRRGRRRPCTRDPHDARPDGRVDDGDVHDRRRRTRCAPLQRGSKGLRARRIGHQQLTRRAERQLPGRHDLPGRLDSAPHPDDDLPDRKRDVVGNARERAEQSRRSHYVPGQERLLSLEKKDIKALEVQTASPMPSFNARLTPEEMSDVIAYLLTLKG